MDVDMKTSPPSERYTVFSQALLDLGLMTEIYGAPQVKILSKDIVDKTGISVSQISTGEIPRDISQMVISTLNGIGGKVVLIPHDAVFMSDYRALGYSRFEQKFVPDIVLIGGISEFDRGLLTRGTNTNFSLDTKDFADGKEMWFGPQTFGFDYWGSTKESFARIGLDFILMDFATLSGIQKVQASNTIEVSKATADKEMAFTLFGPTFGLKGTVKKIQGRHGAIRLMVELSMIQMIGKYLKLPYWRLLPNAKPDPVVMEAVEKEYIMMGDIQRIAKIQELLLMHGYNYVQLTGRLDEQTCKALSAFDPAYSCNSQSIKKDLYLKLYESVPITREALKRRFLIGRNTSQTQQGHLYVETEPANATVRFLNVKSEFYQGMSLDPGRYLLEVSLDYDDSYQSQKMWVTMDRDDRTLKIVLPPNASSFQGP